jgi:hypothetical protein
LILEHFGIIDYLDKYNLNKEDKYKLISLFLNRNKQNTKNYIINLIRGSKEQTPSSQKNYFIKTPENIDFINNLLNELGLKDKEK